jgi:2-keto-4-pentenoate hydratase/2-oxohepta-3-ene-1,7-dioic acid hydratase in catechol pathway
VRLLSPILPSKVVCVGRNYADHAAELGNEVPKEPLLFLKPSTAVIGPNDAIRLPPQSQRVEHEAELAVVIGLRRPPVDRAGRRKRDLRLHLRQRRHRPRPAAQRRAVHPGQGLRLVLPDRALDRHRHRRRDVEVRCEVNEEVRQLGRTKDMVFDGRPCVVCITRHDAAARRRVLTGTPAGVGPLAAGDEVSVLDRGFGALTNRVLTLE